MIIAARVSYLKRDSDIAICIRFARNLSCYSFVKCTLTAQFALETGHEGPERE